MQHALRAAAATQIAEVSSRRTSRGCSLHLSRPAPSAGVQNYSMETVQGPIRICMPVTIGYTTELLFCYTRLPDVKMGFARELDVIVDMSTCTQATLPLARCSHQTAGQSAQWPKHTNGDSSSHQCRTPRDHYQILGPLRVILVASRSRLQWRTGTWGFHVCGLLQGSESQRVEC